MNPGLVDRVWELAGDVGRLRSRCEPDSSLEHLADRIGRHVAAIDSMLRPSAAEIAAWATGAAHLEWEGAGPNGYGSAPSLAGDDDETIAEAIGVVDVHCDRLRARLRLPEPAKGKPWHELNDPLTPDEQASWDRISATALLGGQVAA